MRINQQFLHRGITLALLLGVTPALVYATDLSSSLPRPGLYRIDMDGTFTMPVGGMKAGFRQRTDGNTGDVVANQFGNGERTPDQFYKGNGPATLCIKPYVIDSTSDAATIAAITKVAAACPDQSTVYTSDGYIHKANCATSEMTLTVKKIDTDTWEYTTETTMFQSTAGPDVNGMRFIAENMAKNGATPAERDKARKLLAELPEMQKKMSQGQIDAIAQMKEAQRTAKTPEEAAMLRTALARMTGQTPTVTAFSKERRTRISNSCDVPVK